MWNPKNSFYCQKIKFTAKIVNLVPENINFVPKYFKFAVELVLWKNKSGVGKQKTVPKNSKLCQKFSDEADWICSEPVCLWRDYHKYGHCISGTSCDSTRLRKL